MLILEDTVSNSIVEYFNLALEKFYKDNLVDSVLSCTKNGYETPNIISLIDINYLSEIIDKTTSYINQYYLHLSYFEFYIDHIHLIKYNIGGYQVGHTHCKMEDHSFILYLNDSDGLTRIYFNGNYYDVVPKKNKIVFFNAALFHEGLICSNEKRILVGSIRFRHKIWKNTQL